MKFIINSTIVFHVAERTISNEEKTIRLSNPGARLLLVLLENKNDYVSRDLLLKRIWEDYGITASGNSLTNNISILRRNLAELGAEGVIETIPKQGVMLRPDELDFTEIAEDYVFTQQSIVQPLIIESKKLRRVVMSVSSVLITLCMIIILMKIFKNHSEWFFYKTINKCQIFYPDGVKVNRLNEFFNDASHASLLKACSKDSYIYYDDARVDLSSGISDVFVSVCSLNLHGDLDECRNYVEVKIN